nr:hypothetical protein [Tanacetum cinerariifolium]
MNVSSISEAMQSTLMGRLKWVCNRISFLKTPTREVGLKNPYLICDYYGGSREADECEQDNPSEQVCLSGGDIYNDPSLIRLKKQKKDDEDERLLSIYKQIHINLPFLEAMIHMPNGAKVLKDLLSHKEKIEKAASSVKLSEECSAIIQKESALKRRDPGRFTLPCLIGPLAVKNPLADLGASINLMPHSLFQKLGISKLKPTKISIQLADRSIKYPIGVCENLLMKISKFIFPVDFVVFEIDEDKLLPIILGPFLAMLRAVIDVHEGKLSLRVGSETITFNIGKSMKSKHSRDDYLYCADHTAKLNIVGEPLEWKAPKNQLKPSSVEPPQLELKELSEHLEYAFLQENNQLPVVISSALSSVKKTRLLEMLERLAGHEYYCFLDGFSGYFQIHIASEDQEKTTFTCLYGTFAYKRMPFELCNGPATFQRCMTTIFHELIEDSMEVFMDDFSIFGSSFDHCLKNLEKMLKRYKEINLVLNWKKMPLHGHADFYRRFIKDFSQIARPMTQLLAKDAPFNFSEECIQALDTLKCELTQAPIMIKLYCSLPFEIMCDASDYVVGAVIGQRIDKTFQAHTLRQQNNEQSTRKEFDIEIHDKKGAENLAADHLSRLKNPDLRKLITLKIK